MSVSSAAEEKLRWRKRAGKRSLKKSSRRKAAAIAALIAFILILYRFNCCVAAPAAVIAEEKLHECVTVLMNEAFLETLREYSANGAGSFTRQELREDGTGVIYIDSASVSLFAAKITDGAQRRLMNAPELDISVPVGTISGVAVLNGAGPRIRATAEPMGAVTSRISSEFTSAGVNQTKYSAYLTLDAEFRVLVNGSSRTVTVCMRAPLIETIVVGKSPQAYTDVSSLDEALNLIPTNID